MTPEALALINAALEQLCRARTLIDHRLRGGLAPDYDALRAEVRALSGAINIVDEIAVRAEEAQLEGAIA